MVLWLLMNQMMGLINHQNVYNLHSNIHMTPSDQVMLTLRAEHLPKSKPVRSYLQCIPSLPAKSRYQQMIVISYEFVSISICEAVPSGIMRPLVES